MDNKTRFYDKYRSITTAIIIVIVGGGAIVGLFLKMSDMVDAIMLRSTTIQNIKRDQDNLREKTSSMYARIDRMDRNLTKLMWKLNVRPEVERSRDE